MEPEPKPIESLLPRADQGCAFIPEYQRHYSWSVDNAHYLIRDVIASIDANDSHWLGVFIVRSSDAGLCELGRSGPPFHKCVEIIDGQQRLVTLYLWMTALRDHARDTGQPFERELPCVQLQFPDSGYLESITSDPVNAVGEVSQISNVYLYFRYLLWLGSEALRLDDPLDLPAFKFETDSDGIEVRRSLAELFIGQHLSSHSIYRSESTIDLVKQFDGVDKLLNALKIILAEGEDAVDVFAALNGNRVPLTQFDLLRNFIYEKLGTFPAKQRSKIWRERWMPIEKVFSEIPIGSGNTLASIQEGFLYDYLISIGRGTGVAFKTGTSFFAFRRFFSVSDVGADIPSWLEGFLDEVVIWDVQRSNFSHASSLPSGRKMLINTKARRSLSRIRFGSSGPASPLVMLVLRRSALPSSDERHFTKKDVEEVFTWLETYIFKTLLAGGSMTNLRSEVMSKLPEWEASARRSGSVPASYGIVRDLKQLEQPRWKEINPLILAHHRQEIPPKKSVPSGLYDSLKSKRTLAVLDAVNQALGGTSSLLASPDKSLDPPFQVEHIYPQSSSKWDRDQNQRGVSRSELRARTNSLGNLSALSREVNIKLSRKPFLDKKEDLREQFAIDPHRVPKLLNSWALDRGGPTNWTPRDIDRRSRSYLKELKKIWPNP
jgi:Protein of unknown function DUF262/Protein of unknown function (DUF1524)